MRQIIFLLSLVLTISMSAQVNFEFTNIFANAFIKPTAKSKFGKYKAQKIKGEISGMGVFVHNNGDLYFGDLYEKDFHGKGTLLSSDTINNCPGASIYVGKFKNGLKSGFGRCYNRAGELLYEGMFKNDKPIDSYPNSSLQRELLPYFTEITTDEYTFLGEFIEDYPNGMGIFVFSDGNLYLTEMIAGSPNGISVLIKPDNNWISEKITDGISYPISSSSEYENLKKQANENFRTSLSEALNYFSQAVQTGAQAATQVKSISAGNPIQLDNPIMDTQYADSDSHSNSNPNSNSKDKYNLSEQQNYNRDKSTYHKYDGLLAKAFSRNTYATDSEIKEWQSKMKQLREKWEKKGRDFPHFPNEDK